MKGIKIEAPLEVFEKNSQSRQAPPLVRVERMIEEIKSNLPGQPQFSICFLSEDDDIMRKLLLDFYVSLSKQKPDQIIILT